MRARGWNDWLILGLLAVAASAAGATYFRMRVRRAASANALRPHDRVAIKSDVVQGDRCPNLTSWVVSPLQTSVGGWIDVGVSAADEDPGEIVSYAWEPASRFVEPRRSATRFQCGAAGRQALRLRVSDNHQPVSCSTWFTMFVDCVPG
jgi:hypothetical protein